MTEAEAKQFLKRLDRYLLTWLGNQLADKVKDKIAEMLGVGNWWSLMKMDYPYKKVVEYVGMGFALAYFYAYWIQNQNLGLNPYNPAKEDEREQYVQYLLYSWAGGKPGYIYQFSKQGERIKAQSKTPESVLGRYGY